MCIYLSKIPTHTHQEFIKPTKLPCPLRWLAMLLLEYSIYTRQYMCIVYYPAKVVVEKGRKPEPTHHTYMYICTCTENKPHVVYIQASNPCTVLFELVKLSSAGSIHCTQLVRHTTWPYIHKVNQTCMLMYRHFSLRHSQMTLQHRQSFFSGK